MGSFSRTTLITTAFVGCALTPIVSASPIIGDLEFSGRSSTMRMGEFRNVLARSGTVSGAVVSPAAVSGGSASSTQAPGSSVVTNGSAGASVPVILNSLPTAALAFSASPSSVVTTVQASAPALSTATTIPQGGVSLAAAVNVAAVDPVPEPSTWAMLLFGVGLIGFTVRSKRNLVRQ